MTRMWFGVLCGVCWKTPRWCRRGTIGSVSQVGKGVDVRRVFLGERGAG